MQCKKCGHSAHWHLVGYNGKTQCLWDITSLKDEDVCLCTNFTSQGKKNVKK